MTDYQTITLEQAGPVARITLNRPDAANGMNDTMTRELADAAARCDTPATKVVVVTGAGRFFCAGGDLKDFAAAPSRGRHIKGVADDLHRAIATFARMDAVVITAVNGTAAGAGFSLAVIGDLVLAIGNPFGVGQTVTNGIISALNRTETGISDSGSFIQTDAAINSGNSGGALLNLRGELIGINTAILGPNGGNIGIGFAIPSNMVRDLSEQIVKYGEVRRGQLGITGTELTSEIAKTFGYNKKDGAFVNQVMPDSAAAKAGIKAGDIIISIDGKPIRSFGELRAKIATMGADKQVSLGLIRDGKEQTVKVTLKKADDSEILASALHPALEGAKLSTTTDPVTGVAVSDIDPRSPAAASGLQKGDIIIGVNRQRINSMGELTKVLKNKPEVLALNIQRGDSSLYLVIR